MYLFGGLNGISQNLYFYKLDLSILEWEIVDYLDENHSIKTRDNHSAVIYEHN